jgi:hypothetical protein
MLVAFNLARSIGTDIVTLDASPLVAVSTVLPFLVRCHGALVDASDTVCT